PGDLAVLPAGDEALVLRLDGINPGNVNSAEVAALLALIESQTGQSIAQDLFESFGAAMEGEVGIRVNQAVINQVHSQFR
ncbi:MAG: peptidylprolyl isomerase, partial [Pseudomonadota bacterium]